MNKLILLLFVGLTINHTHAQWTNNTDLNTPVCTASFKQKEQRIESDGKGGAFIVWRDWRTGTDSSDIYVQRVDSNGISLWGNNGLRLCNETSDESAPSITTDENDGVIVVWSDERSGGERDVYAQRVDANGNIKWAFNGVPVANKLEREHSVKIISDDNSGAIVAWEQERTNFTWDIWLQRIDSNGIGVWPAGGIPVCNVAANRINHKIQRDGEGGVIVTWQDERSGNFDIYAQRIDANGNIVWNPAGVLVCGAANVQTNPKIDPEKELDGVFIAWVDKRNGQDYDVYANRIDSAGNVLWGTNGKPVVVAANNQSAIDILSNNKIGGLVVTWKDFRGLDYDIYAQKLDLNGNPLWQLNGVAVVETTGNQVNPNIISDKNGGVIIAWQDSRNGNEDIYTQRLNPNGVGLWLSNGEPVSTAVEGQESPKNIPDNKGGSIYVWEDKRGGVSKDIYIHHLLIPDTAVVDTQTSVFNFSVSNQFKIYPNPFNNFFSVEMDLNETQTIDVALFDFLGRSIWTQEKNLDRGKQELRVDLTDLSINNGIYLLRINDQSVLLIKKEP